jgi:hypothetical protein
MTDEQLERLIWKEIKKRDITIHDMIGMPGHGVDTNPEDKITPPCKKGIRSNRFESFMGCDRMKELLCVGKYSEWDDYPPLKIPFQDLFRFWWHRCVVQEYVLDEVLEDIFEYFTEKMRPAQKEEPQMDFTLDFEQVLIFTALEDTPRQMTIGEKALKPPSRPGKAQKESDVSW